MGMCRWACVGGHVCVCVCVCVYEYTSADVKLLSLVLPGRP